MYGTRSSPIVLLRPGQRPERRRAGCVGARPVVDRFGRRHIGGGSGGARRSVRIEGGRRVGSGRRVRVGPECGEQRGTDSAVERRLGRGDHRKLGVFGKPLSDKGNACPATDDRNRGQAGRRGAVALGQFVQCGDDAVQRSLDQFLQFVSGEPNIGSIALDVREPVGSRYRPTAAPWPACTPPATWSATRLPWLPPGSTLSARLSRTWASNAWSIRSPEKSGYRTVSPMGSKRRRGVGQGDAGAASAEVEQCHHAVRGDTRVGLQRSQGGDGVGDAPEPADWSATGSCCCPARFGTPISSSRSSAREPRSRRRTTAHRPARPWRRALRPGVVRRGSSSRRGSPAAPGPRRARRSR